MASDFYQSKLDPREHVNAADRILAVSVRYCNAVAGITVLQDQLGLALDSMKDILNRSFKGEFTELLFQKDIVRDSAYRALRYYLLAWSYRPADEMKVSAAARLIEVLDQRGAEFLSYGYSRESAEMEAVFKDLDALQALLDTIEATPWYADLKKTQQEFEETFQTKITSEAKQDFPQLRAARNVLTQNLTALLNYVDVLVQTNDQNALAANKEIQAIIDEMMAIAKARDTRQETAAKADKPEAQ